MRGLKNCQKCNGRGYRIIDGTILDCECQPKVKALANRQMQIDHEIACLYHGRLPSWVFNNKLTWLKTEMLQIENQIGVI